jgi:hypothetical protein
LIEINKCAGRAGFDSPAPLTAEVILLSSHIWSPHALSVLSLAIILGGVFAGALLRRALPHKLLTDDAKDIIRLGTGLIGTIAALVLGLLIASAKTSYDTQSSQVQHLTADVVLLDQLLKQYGPETRPIRELLRRGVGSLADQIWRDNPAGTKNEQPFAATAVAQSAFAMIGELTPKTDPQSSLKARAVAIVTDLAQTRVALFVQTSSSVPVPFLAVLIFWLAIIFASFSLFARLNGALIVVLFVFALSASAALFLILEMGEPFTGLMRIPSAPLRNALAAIVE